MPLSTTFSAHLALSDDQKTELLEAALIVFDTNVLLSMYRMGHGTRVGVMTVLDRKLKGRVWIPYQVGLEFFRNRRDRIKEDSARVEETARRLSSNLESLNLLLSEQKLAEIGCTDEETELRDLIVKAKRIVENAITPKAQAYPKLTDRDAVLEFWDSMIGDNIGPAPASQAVLDSIQKLMLDRYARKQPPGYRDEKAKRDQNFFYDGVVYNAAAGDLIVWLQLLEAARADPVKFKNVVLVTSDRTDDWWDIVEGKAQGPRIELKQEAAAAGISRFHMYTFDALIQRLQEDRPRNEQLTTEALEEVNVAASTGARDLYDVPEVYAERDLYSGGLLGVVNRRRALDAFVAWLKQTAPQVEVLSGAAFPDVTATLVDDGGRPVLLGIEIVAPRNPVMLSAVVIRKIKQAQPWLASPSGGLLDLTRKQGAVAVVLVPEWMQQHDSSLWEGVLGSIRRRLEAADMFLYVGVLSESGEFEPQ